MSVGVHIFKKILKNNTKSIIDLYQILSPVWILKFVTYFYIYSHVNDDNQLCLFSVNLQRFDNLKEMWDSLTIIGIPDIDQNSYFYMHAPERK